MKSEVFFAEYFHSDMHRFIPANSADRGNAKHMTLLDLASDSVFSFESRLVEKTFHWMRDPILVPFLASLYRGHTVLPP